MKLFSKNPPRQGILEMPVEVRFIAAPADWRVTRFLRAGVDVFEWRDVGQSTDLDIAHAFDMRDAFFSIHTPDELETFLRNSGPFRADGFSLTWPIFLAWKDYLSRQRLSPAKWGALPESVSDSSRMRIIGEPSLRTWPVNRGSKKAQVTLLLECDSVLEAIAATNYLDRRAGVVAKTCPGCGDPFIPLTKRARTCGKRCTHKIGQKRRRGEKIDGVDGKA